MTGTRRPETYRNFRKPAADRSSFGWLLRRHRLAAKLTQEALADRAGLSVRGISDLERGARTRPQRETLKRLINALDLSDRERDVFTSASTNAPPTGAAKSQTTRSFTSLENGPMVERDTEMAHVFAMLAEVEDGEGMTVLLSGEPGAGKTRMTQELVERVDQRGFFVGVGRCYESEQTAPFYPFLDALEALHAASPPDIQAAVHDRWPYLDRLLPHGSVPLPANIDARIQEAQLLLRSAQGYIQDLSAVGPVVVVLEDLHWADDSSIRMLQHLARHTRSFPILLLCTYRSTDAASHPRLEAALRDLDREQLTRTIGIPPLSKQGVERFIAASIGSPAPALLDWIHAHTEGNPFFVQEVLRALVEQKLLVEEHGMWLMHKVENVGVPASVQAVTTDRVARLSHGTQRAIQHASVLGSAFNFDDLNRMTDCSEVDLEQCLDEASLAGLVRSTGPDQYAFSHALIQQAVQASLSPRLSRRLHQLAAQSLLQLDNVSRDRRANELARHFLDGNQPREALPWMLLAGDHARDVFAQSEAEATFRQALELSIALGDANRTAEAQAKLGAVLATIARYDEALAVLEPAAETYHALRDLDRLAGTLRPMLTVHAFRGTPGQGAARTAHLVRALEAAEPSPVLASVYVQLATLFHFDSQYDQQLRVAEQAVNLAALVGDPGILAAAEDVRGYALCMLGAIDEGLPVLEGALLHARCADHPEILSNTLGHLAIGHLACGQFAATRRELDEAVAAAKRLGHPALAAIWVAAQAYLALLSADWLVAREQCEQALDVSRAVGSSSWSAYPLFLLGWIELVEGSWERAGQLLEQAVALANRTANMQGRRIAAHASARLEIRRGHPERAVARLTQLLDRRRHGGNGRDVHAPLPCSGVPRVRSGEQGREHGLGRCSTCASAAPHARVGGGSACPGPGPGIEGSTRQR